MKFKGFLFAVTVAMTLMGTSALASSSPDQIKKMYDAMVQAGFSDAYTLPTAAVVVVNCQTSSSVSEEVANFNKYFQAFSQAFKSAGFYDSVYATADEGYAVAYCKLKLTTASPKEAAQKLLSSYQALTPTYFYDSASLIMTAAENL